MIFTKKKKKGKQSQLPKHAVFITIQRKFSDTMYLQSKKMYILVVLLAKIFELHHLFSSYYFPLVFQ